MKIKKYIYAACLGGILLGNSSCSDWLKVNMEDSIMENSLYSNTKGYMIALNGLYLELNRLYIPSLTMGEIDVMAQYYNVTENIDHRYKIYAGYKYSDGAFESFNNNIWTKAFEIIANTNVLLEHCNENGSAISEEYYPIVKGEALALRAMLHFDLLRLYGPVFNDQTASTLTMPYQMSSSKEVQPLLPAGEVLEKIIKDLEEAVTLLKSDPIITEGVMNKIPEDDGLGSYDLSYRQIRMNYYAAQLLRARAYMWKGDKQTAGRIAKEEILAPITTEELEVFPWCTEGAYIANGKQDYIFSSEVFFALYNTNRSQQYSSLFAKELSTSSRLTFVGNTLEGGDSKTGTFYDDTNDWRKKMWDLVEPTEEEKKAAAEAGREAEPTLYFNKYKDFDREAVTDGSETYRYMIPLMRLSEVYLIAAECTTDPSEAVEYLNEIRRHRSCIDLGEGISKDDAITYEFAREVIGEGQLFFYYKRLGKTEIISGFSPTDPFTMQQGYYTWPLPKAEIDKRGSNAN